MLSGLFQAIGSRLSLVIAIMLSGFVVVMVTAVQFLNQLELAYEKRGQFHEQALVLHRFHESFLQSVVLVDRVLFDNTKLEQFTYTVSHDLKSPLVTVKGFLGLLEGDIKGGDSERVNGDIRHIVSATDSMGNLLDLSRIGRVVNPPEPVALNALVENALFSLQGAIEESGVKVEV
jgi:signal transduction histidine kinase